MQSKLKNAIEYIKNHLKTGSLSYFPDVYEIDYLLRMGVRNGTNDVWAFHTIDKDSKDVIYVNSKFIEIFQLDRIIETLCHEIMHCKERELNREKYEKMTTEDTKTYRNTVEDEINSGKFLDIFDDELQSKLSVDNKKLISGVLSRFRIKVMGEDDFRKLHPLD